MNRLATFDLAVIGGDAAAFAAAGCAAKAGAKVVVLLTPCLTNERSTPAVPDFVWRRLDLYDAGLDAKPVAAMTSLFDDGRSIATYPSPARTEDALRRHCPDDAPLLADFNAAMKRLRQNAETLLHAAPDGRRLNLLDLISGERGADRATTLSASTLAVLSDYFSDERLKIHLANIALSPFGLGGDEPASALALASVTEPAAWRIRAKNGGQALRAALENAARLADVEIVNAKIVAIDDGGGKTHVIRMDDGEDIKARAVMVSGAHSASVSNVPTSAPFQPLARPSRARAAVTLTFAAEKHPPNTEQDAVYFLADSLSSFAAARDAASEGRFVERPPLFFEADGTHIRVEAPWCPAWVRIEGESRDWTEQDRQALGRSVLERVAPHLSGGAEGLLRIETTIIDESARAAGSAEQGAQMPAASHDPIGAAARLALHLVTHG